MIWYETWICTLNKSNYLDQNYKDDICWHDAQKYLYNENEFF